MENWVEVVDWIDEIKQRREMRGTKKTERRKQGTKERGTREEVVVLFGKYLILLIVFTVVHWGTC
jgi:hypothetical protein